MEVEGSNDDNSYDNEYSVYCENEEYSAYSWNKHVNNNELVLKLKPESTIATNKQGFFP